MPSVSKPRSSPRQAAAPPRIAIVVSRYNASVTDRLLAGAEAAFASRGGSPDDLHVASAPGSFELPALAAAAARSGRFRGVVTLGCIIKGETSHDQYIAHAVAQGLVQITINTGVPCAFGVLTVDSPEQADARAGGVHGNKGDEAMHAVLDTLEQIDQMQTTRSTTRISRNAAAPGFGRQLPDKAARPTNTRKPASRGGPR